VISIEDLCVSNGQFRLEGINLEVATGAYGVLMGRTGCGKTTVLETICGLKRPQRGAIRLMGRNVTRLKAAERGIGYVPQDRSLFQTMTVAENIGFAARIRHWPRDRIRQRVDELAELLGLTDLLTRMPAGLSGGEAQRVALGRALAVAPGMLCLDEPLSNLDYDTRLEMCDLLKTVQKRTGVTTIHVTHDRDQVRMLADTLFQFNNGSVRRVTDMQFEEA
jgi:molybdate/tungstate transport system ATP-binding protein